MYNKIRLLAYVKRGQKMKKLKFIAKKTGLSEREISGFSKLSVFGIIVVLLTSFAGCLKNKKADLPTAQSIETKMSADKPAANEKTGDKKTDAKKIEPAKSDNCGPYPGYPCGTKYYTVSAEDFC